MDNHRLESGRSENTNVPDGEQLTRLEERVALPEILPGAPDVATGIPGDVDDDPLAAVVGILVPYD